MTACLTPTKRHWATPELADGHRLLLLHNAQSARKTPDALRLHVYRCPCGGGWCIGHAKYPLERAS
jgi:hypothetical protein